ncbi:AMP-binding protein [Dactylosporangium sp. NPDC051541]|uniref:non-ribosomal peptide synthetase n=1 Tax=Dactylosporangium sp. NPDC051541 TaxID=3363977 RepID=UPI0037A3C8B2
MIPLTDAQHGVWFAEQLGGHRGAYNLGLVADLHGDLDVAALDRAVTAVVARHPVLAAAVHMEHDRPNLRLGHHSIALTKTDDDPQDLLAREYDVTGSEPLARFALQTVSPDHHRLVIGAHHLVFDGQSKDIVLRHLADAYNGNRDHPPAEYAAAVETQRGRPQRATPLEPVVLPDLGPGPRPASLEVPIDADLPAAARAIGVTTFELLVTTLQLLLHRYGNDPATIAIATNARDRQHSDVIGMFVNELPVTVPGPGPSTFAEFAATTRAALRDLYRRRPGPVATTTGATASPTAGMPADTSAGMSVSYRRQGPAPSFDGLRTVVDWAPSTAVRGSLHVQIVDVDDCLLVRLTHDDRLVGGPAAAAVARHLGQLLNAAARQPFAPAHRLELETAAELSGPAAGPATTLTALLAEVATGTEPAVISSAVQLPQEQVHAAARRLASRLVERGVGPGQVIGLCAERGLPLLIGLLAIVRTGAAYLPLDPQYPTQRIRFMLADATPMLVLCTPNSIDLVEGAPTLLLDDIVVDVDDNQRRLPTPVDPAYVMYTSGSTGRPKGVVIPHRAIVNLLQSMLTKINVGPGDVWLWLTSLSFDIAAVECFLPLLAGATIVIAADDQVRDGTALLNLIAEHGVTHVQATPSTWELILAAAPDPAPLAHLTTAPDPAPASLAQLIAAPAPAPLTQVTAPPAQEPLAHLTGPSQHEPLAHLTGPSQHEPLARVTALSGGEPLTQSLAERLRSRVARLINAYGPTETTVWSTFVDIDDPRHINIGLPIAGTAAYVVDQYLQRVPVGVVGQLALAGVGVADYYHRRPGLTAERFLPDPFGAPGSRLYLTGDLARIGADGRLHCLGREDQQVKLRGHRIELGEIEARLRDQPGVSGAVVTVDRDTPGGRLIAYITGMASDPTDRGPANPGPANVNPANLDPANLDPANLGPANLDPGHLRAQLAAQLPAVMVPALIVRLDALPMTPNGKLDRNALPAPPPAEPAPVETPASSGDAVVVAVTEIWREALQRPDVGADEDLFDLGGHSLTVTQIAARIRARLGVDLPLHVLWDGPTIAQTAAAVRAELVR